MPVVVLFHIATRDRGLKVTIMGHGADAGSKDNNFARCLGFLRLMLLVAAAIRRTRDCLDDD